MEIQPVTTPEYKFRERDSDFARLEGLRDAQYKRYISVAELSPTASGTLVTADGVFQAVEMSTGADESCNFSFMRPDLWTNGTLQLKYVWATDGADTTDIRFISLIQVQKGDVSTTIINSSVDLTPTGTADDVQIQTVTASTVLDADDTLIGFRIQRKGTVDSNSDEGLIFGASLEFLPTHRQ